MLHIHKNVDGTYWIQLEILDSNNTKIVSFRGNFQLVDTDENSHEQDLVNKFVLNVPVNLSSPE